MTVPGDRFSPLRWTVYGVAFGLAVLLPVMAVSQREQKTAPPAPGKERGGDPTDQGEREQLRRRMALTLFVQERGQKLALRRAETLLQAGKTVDGLRLLQRLLDLPEDRFTWTGRRVAATGVRQRAEDVLSGLNREALATYERLFGVEAKRLVDRAQRKGETRHPARGCAEVLETLVPVPTQPTHWR